MGQPLQRNIFKNLLVNAGNHEYSRLSFHPVWSVFSLNNNISSYLMNCQPSPEEDTLMSGESCPMLIYLSQEHRSDNDLFSSMCLIRVSVRPLPDPYKGNLHKKVGTCWMVTEFHSSQLRELQLLTEVDWMSTQSVLKDKSGGAERERKRPGLVLQLELVGKHSFELHTANASVWSNYQKLVNQLSSSPCWLTNKKWKFRERKENFCNWHTWNSVAESHNVEKKL